MFLWSTILILQLPFFAYGCFECNVDFYGNDVKTIAGSIKNVSECQQECVSHSGCSYFTFVPQWNDCYLKSSNSGSYSDNQNTLGFVSGPKTCSSLGGKKFEDCSECNTDFYGDDLKAIYISPWRVAAEGEGTKSSPNNSSLNDDISDIMLSGPLATNSNNNNPNKKKKDNTRFLAAQDYHLAMQRRKLSKNNRQALANVSNDSYTYKACIKECRNNTKCTHFTYVPNWGGCYLKSSSSAQPSHRILSYGTLGFVSSTKSCVQLMDTPPEFGGTSTSTTPPPTTTTAPTTISTKPTTSTTTAPPTTTTTTTPPPTTTTTTTPPPTNSLPITTKPYNPEVDCFEIGVDYFGNDLWREPATDPRNCQVVCGKFPTCEFWSFNSGFCYMKSAKDIVIINSNTSDTVSGPRECPVFNSDETCEEGQYAMVRAYSEETLYDPANFGYFTDDDPTGGFVNYVDYNQALSKGYIKTENQKTVFSVDAKSIPGAFSRGRDSTRITSRHGYDDGLWVLSMNHMPTGCGTWPAFWLAGVDPWPMGGEVDIIEGANNQTKNHVALHTLAGCTMDQSASNLFTGVWCPDSKGGIGLNCYHGATDTNLGCCIDATEDSFGAPLNAGGGGVFVTEVDRSKFVRVWKFSKDNLPPGIYADFEQTKTSTIYPEPESWKNFKPMAVFPLNDDTCNGKIFFKGLRVVLNTTFCGGYSGYRFLESEGCPGDGIDDCEEYVRTNPQAFQDAYWDINYVGIYRRHYNNSEEGGCRTASEERFDGLTRSERLMKKTASSQKYSTKPKLVNGSFTFVHQTYSMIGGQSTSSNNATNKLDPTPFIQQYTRLTYTQPPGSMSSTYS